VREVEYCSNGYYGKEGAQAPSDLSRGFFHCFATEGNNEDGLECYAIVEKLDGTIGTMSTMRVRFLTPPAKEE
jgi:hypothetical protein